MTLHAYAHSPPPSHVEPQKSIGPAETQRVYGRWEYLDLESPLLTQARDSS